MRTHAALILVGLASCSKFGASDSPAGAPPDMSEEGGVLPHPTEAGALPDSGSTSETGTPSAAVPALVERSSSHAQSATMLTVKLMNPVAAGHCVIVVATNAGDFPTSVSAGGTTFEKIAEKGAHVATAVWWAKVTESSSEPVTVTWPDEVTSPVAVVMEWANLGHPTTPIGSATAGNGEAPLVSTGALTVAPDIAMVLGAAGTQNNSAKIVAATGFTSLEGDGIGFSYVNVAYALGGKAKYTVGWLQNPVEAWDAMLIPFNKITP